MLTVTCDICGCDVSSYVKHLESPIRSVPTSLPGVTLDVVINSEHERQICSDCAVKAIKAWIARQDRELLKYTMLDHPETV